MAKRKGKNKNPKRKESIKTSKQPRGNGRLASSSQKFDGNLFSLKKADAGGKWPLEKVDKQTLYDFLHKICDMDMTSLRHQRSHKVAIEELATDAQKRLDVCELDDLNVLFSLRVTSRERLWAIQQRVEGKTHYYHVFHLLWWDPNHEVCPSAR